METDIETKIDTKTPYSELDGELKSKLNPQLKDSIDNFFKIDTNNKEGHHIVLEEEDPEYIEKMLNEHIESEFSVEPAIDSFKQKVINIYRKVLKRYPNNIELMHHSNMLRYEVSTEEEIENILKNSDDYKRLYATIEQPIPSPKVSQQLPSQVTPQLAQPLQLQPTQSQNTVSPIPDEYHINIIKKVYDEELRREADESGIAVYLNHMKKGMTEEILRKALRNSPEYRQNFGVYQPAYQNVITPVKVIDGAQSQTNSNIQPQSTLQQPTSLQLVYCMMGTNRLHEIKAENYISSILPWIDKFIFIDGESEDGTVEYLKSLGDKVEVYVHPWQDRFSEQRNHYLEKLRERNYNGWVVTSDTDEHYPIESLKQIRQLIPKISTDILPPSLTEYNYNGIKIQVEDIEVDDDNFNKIISRNINQYWKPLVFKFHPNLRYEGEPHETITGYPIKWYKSNILYEHRRSKLHVLQRATENYFISNSNRYSERWAELRFLCTKNGILTFKDYWKLFEKHELPKEIEDWIYSHKDDNQDSGDSEIRETALLYFEVLPERMKKKESDIIYTSPISEKQKPDTEQPIPTMEDFQGIVRENCAIREELGKAIQRIADLTKSSEEIQPSHELPEEAKKAIHNAITRAFENEDSIYEIVPPDNIYIVRIIKSEADIIENRNGESTYRKIKLQE